MSTKFRTKGKGANRKVIPISDKKGGKRVELIGYAVSFPIEKMSEPEREFESSKKYIYKKLDDVEGLISLSLNFDKKDFEKYPGLKEVDEILGQAQILAENAALNAKLLMEKHGGDVGPLVQAIHNSIHNIIKTDYEAYMGLDKVIKKARERNKDGDYFYVDAGYTLPSVMADIEDVEEDLYDADAVLMRTFRDMRRVHYREYRKNHPYSHRPNDQISMPRNRSGDIRVVGDVKSVFNPDGTLRIREFSREEIESTRP